MCQMGKNGPKPRGVGLLEPAAGLKGGNHWASRFKFKKFIPPLGISLPSHATTYNVARMRRLNVRGVSRVGMRCHMPWPSGSHE